MSDIFSLKYFIINYVLNFRHIMFNEKCFNEKFPLMDTVINVVPNAEYGRMFT